MIDIACQRYGFDLIEIRRRNLVSTGSDAMCESLSLGYDNGPASAAERPVNFQVFAGHILDFTEEINGVRNQCDF
jgi:hypothetical protein